LTSITLISLAARYELRVHVGEYPQIAYAAAAQIVELTLDAGEVLDPKRDRRMLE
jgi:hypothetical protein